MDVAGGQQFPLARLEPAPARVALAARAVPVSARVVGDGGRMSAAGAAIAMSAQRGGAAARDSQQHLLVLPVDPPATMFKERLSSTADDVGHLYERPAHELCLFPPCKREREGIERAGGCAEMPLREMQIDGRDLEVTMAEQYLNGA